MIEWVLDNRFADLFHRERTLTRRTLIAYLVIMILFPQIALFLPSFVAY